MSTRWITVSALGEALGIAGVALAYAASGRGLVPAVPAILAAGFWEGACLGTAQASVLRPSGISAGRWIFATIAVAVLGYAGSLAAGGGADAGPGPSVLTLLGAAAGLGLLLGLLMGAAQVWAAAGRIGRAAWLWRSAIGWALAMAAIFAGSALVTDSWPLAAIGLVGAASGALAGGLLGWLTAPALPAITAGS